MNLTLLQRMAGEVSDDTLAELLAQAVTDFDVVDTEQLKQIDVIVTELKKRHGIENEVPTKKAGKQRDYKAEAERRKSKISGSDSKEAGSDGSIRTESGKLQSGKSGTTETLRVGDEAR